MSKKIIISNEAECKKCGDSIFSAHRHDYKSCKCGAIAIDGGLDYQRYVGDFDSIIDKSMYMTQENLNAIKDAVEWGKNNNKNSLGIALAVLRALRDNGLLKDDIFKYGD